MSDDSSSDSSSIHSGSEYCNRDWKAKKFEIGSRQKTREQHLDVLVLPVSGGAFAAQLGMIKLLIQSGYKQDLILGASGGNLSAYVCMAADWKLNGIDRIARTLNSGLFVKRWTPAPIPSISVGYFEGSVYDHAHGIDEIFEMYFTPSTVTRDEIWTATYNRKRQKTCIYCNRSKEESIINCDLIDQNLVQCSEPKYLDGDIEQISKVCKASASIPTVVPPVKIDGENNIDGGMYYASPLTVMQEAIAVLNDGNYHLTYVNRMDIKYDKECGECKNFMDNGMIAVAELVRGKILNDRLTAHSLLRHFGIGKYTEGVCTPKILKQITNTRYQSERSLLELYPLFTVEVDIENFTGKDVLDCVNKAYNNCGYRLWYI